jgi:hypothetical protein
MHVILATQEAEVRRIAVQNQHQANSSYLENTQHKKVLGDGLK